MTITEPNAGVPVLGLDGGIDTLPQPPVEIQAGGYLHERGAFAPVTDPSAPGHGAATTEAIEAYTSIAEPAPRNGARPVAEAAAAAPPAALPIPVPPVPPTRLRTVSGRFRSPAIGFQLELRVDVDGSKPLGRLSGDYYSVTGGTTTYFGSWTVDAVTVTRTPAKIVIVGTARTTWQTTFTVATVTIARRLFFQPPAPATITWSTPSGAQGATYACGFESKAYRTVELEQDCEHGVTPFASYDTSSLPSGGPGRVLTIGAAYREAGVQMLDTGAANNIPQPAGGVWTNDSLHNAMQANFSRWTDRPQFKVWLLHANAHEFGPDLLGIMFDQKGPQRQGCASFYQTISSGSAKHLRDQLYVNVHELGHCFNLFHSFHKQFMTPPMPNRPDALSWMNYPDNYRPAGGGPGGAAAFWDAFPLQFDDLELAHLRHAFRNDIIMGGNPFGTGAALDVAEAYSDSVLDHSGLALRISTAPERPILGTPVVLNVELAVERQQLVHKPEQLHPKYGFVEVVIGRPRGDVVVHRPPVHHCALPNLVLGGREQIYPVSAYIGYDATVGQVFEDVGTYRIRASYTAPDGTVVLSNVATMRIGAPRDDRDDRVADLLLKDQTGMVLTLLGSGSHYLREGTESLRTIQTEYGDHPNAVYARLALGMSAARPFTDVRPDGSMSTRDRNLQEADALVREAVDASRGAEGLDDLTVFQALTYLANQHAAQGDHLGAQSLREDALGLAHAKNAPAAVLESIQTETPNA